ncbi:hypothetical protein H9I45_15045 [Polaribacter haliotis]|uniref:Uncharacterized protein n=1 Tax=Polaribacter haliotis TaxID=1888915 RepID=A0A7L8AF44_9FLAO|nr:hypothetical protein [Polaribacter haliotis]QOD60635.1 hypothetical protein H9I45_15045 [Polaribacter haliotis]
MKTYLLVKLKEEIRVNGGCSPDDPEFAYVVGDCLKSTGEYFVDKKEALKKAKEKTLKNLEKEAFGVIKIDMP